MGRPPHARGMKLAIRRETLATWLVALAILTGSIVFSEPAIADVLMLGAIVGLPILGCMWLGTFTILNAMGLIIVTCLALALAPISATPDTAIKHQLITLYLIFGSLVIAGFVSQDFEPRFRLIMWCYLIACTVATIAGLIGYFRLLPSFYDLFTNYGRLRGTFKDPNVYGAALIPAFTFITWSLFRDPWRKARVTAIIGLILSVGLILSFSRGAWAASALGVAIVAAIAFARGRRETDAQRISTVSIAGAISLVLAAMLLLQSHEIRELMSQRVSLNQSYDSGPHGRFGGQAKAIELMIEHPFGIGTHTFREVHHHEETHNVYLNVTLYSGWFGGLLYLIVVLTTITVGLRRAMRNGAVQGPLVVATAALAALAFEGLVIDTDHWRHFFLVLGLTWGMIDARPMMIETARRRTDPEPLAR